LALEALYGYDTGIDVSRLYEVSQLVERLSGVPVGVAKPLVGPNAFAHESGIHAHGVIKHTATYEPIQPERIGRQRTFVFGKHTGSLGRIGRARAAIGPREDRPAQEVKPAGDGDVDAAQDDRGTEEVDDVEGLVSQRRSEEDRRDRRDEGDEGEGRGFRALEEPLPCDERHDGTGQGQEQDRSDSLRPRRNVPRFPRTKRKGR